MRLRPRLAELYDEKVVRLELELNRPELRPDAAEALRGFIDEIRVIREDGRLEIELLGNLPGLQVFASENPRRIAPRGANNW